MTHYQAILGHINAVSPCTYKGVIAWAKSQGFGGSKMVFAINAMIRDGVISITNEDGQSTIDLI